MPGAWSEEARRTLYVKRYGEQEGDRRFQIWQAKHQEEPQIDGPMGSEQRPIRVPGEKSPKRSKKRLTRSEVTAFLDSGLPLLEKGVVWLYPPWEQDKLSYEERGRLSDALSDEILDSERLTKWVLKLQSTGKHTKLIYVLVSIALPRMQKHGVLPGGASSEEAAADASASPFQMAGGGAYGADRNDGFGQVDIGSTAQSVPPVFPSSAEQVGQDYIPQYQDNANGVGHDRSPVGAASSST